MQKIIVIFFIIFSCVPAFSNEFDIKHVEPLHWWVGMHHPELQLMLHGENIAQLTPNINYPGVTIAGVEKTDNKNYLFINLIIADTTKAGSFDISLTLNERVKNVSRYTLEPRAKNSSQRRGFNSKDAIYLIVPDRFSNGISGNDSHVDLIESANRSSSGGRHGGDIKGMQNHLDYIADMGFTMIWPTPLIENNMEAYSYHGYSATNHYQIDKRFGTNQDFKNFVVAANKKGIGVIQDVVLNHIGSGHWWMKDLPAADWINFSDNYAETTHHRTTIHDIHAAPEDKKLFTDGSFVKTMPDLNQRNPLLAKYLIQNSVWWIEYANLSGIREDTYSYSDRDFLTAWGKYIFEEYPNFNIVGEEWTGNHAIIASWQKGKKVNDGYETHLPSLMDFPVYEALRTGLLEEEHPGSGLLNLYATIANDFLYGDPMNMVVFPENHDTSRIFSAMNEDIDLFKTVMVFTATTRGIPQYFYGSEVLLKSPKERDDGAVRADMPGGWRGDSVNVFTGKGLSARQRDAQEFIKKLLNWRKTSDAIKEGKLLHYAPENSVYVYFRYTAEQPDAKTDEKTDAKKVMVIINKNKNNSVLDLSRFKTALKGKLTGRSVLTNVMIDLTKPLELKAATSMIIEI